MTDTASKRAARPSAGDVVDPFVLADAEGVAVAVDFREAPATVLVFTSSGCPYALAWHDRIQDVARDYDPDGVRTVQILSNDPDAQPADGVGRLRERLSVGEFAYPVLLDSEQELARRLGATATPEVFVIDRDGVIRYHGAPDANHDDAALRASWVREAVEAVLADQPVARPSTSPAGCSIKWRIELLWTDGCPSHNDALALLNKTLSDMGREDVVVRPVRISTRRDAEDRSFPGSPTFQVGRLDLFPEDAEPALGCRLYRHANGKVSPLPAQDELETALREALARPWDLRGWTDFRAQTTQPASH